MQKYRTSKNYKMCPENAPHTPGVFYILINAYAVLIIAMVLNHTGKLFGVCRVIVKKN